MPRREPRPRTPTYVLVAVIALLATTSAGAGASERPREGWIVFPTPDLDGAQIVSAPVAAGAPSQLTLIFSSAEPSSPALSPDGNLIAFEQWSPQRTAIWVMRTDGSGRRRVTTGSGPAWSPNGRRIAFVDRDGRIATVRLDGSGLRHVLVRRGASSSPPRWSPDGAWIAYSSGETLWVVRPDGTGAHRLAKARFLDFSWSPNGRRLAYAAAEGKQDIFTVSVRGGRPKRLTDNNAIEGAPEWSPDGRHIAFWSESSYVMVVAAEGSGPARRALRGVSPSWSPDGSKLAVRRNDEVWVARVDGRFPRRVSRGTGVVPWDVEEEEWGRTRPVWTRDGRRILFSRLSHVPGELVAVSPSGRERRRLTRNRHREVEPAWSPDGRMVAFARVVGRYPSSTQEICVIRADGTRFRRLTRGKTDSQPAWSPDGTEIVFARRTGAETAALYRIPTAGGAATRMAATTKGHPAWAPGSLIAVDGIELMRPNGEPAGRATQPPERGYDSQADWAADGRRFVFLRNEDPPCRQCEIQYLAIGELGSEAVRAIQPSNWDFELTSPSWSPDGSRIAAVVTQGGPLVTINPDGSDRQVLARSLADEPEIDWGPAP